MNKRKYKELLRLRQTQELMFFEIIGNLKPTGLTVRDIIDITNMPCKRAWYILEKWSNKGWYDYGVTLDLGWLTIKKMPLANI